MTVMHVIKDLAWRCMTEEMLSKWDHERLLSSKWSTNEPVQFIIMDLLTTHAYQSTIALGFYVLATKDMTIVHYAMLTTIAYCANT